MPFIILTAIISIGVAIFAIQNANISTANGKTMAKDSTKALRS